MSNWRNSPCRVSAMPGSVRALFTATRPDGSPRPKTTEERRAAIISNGIGSDSGSRSAIFSSDGVRGSIAARNGSAYDTNFYNLHHIAELSEKVRTFSFLCLDAKRSCSLNGRELFFRLLISLVTFSFCTTAEFVYMYGDMSTCCFVCFRNCFISSRWANSRSSFSGVEVGQV